MFWRYAISERFRYISDDRTTRGNEHRIPRRGGRQSVSTTTTTTQFKIKQPFNSSKTPIFFFKTPIFFFKAPIFSSAAGLLVRQLEY